jgi:glycosyl transferase family 25
MVCCENAGFASMKAYCINLDSRPDRLAHMTALMARHGLAFERVAAVDGGDPQVAAAAARCPTGRNGYRLSAGAYACFQSHREIWRRLLASGASHAMVLEDDLLIATGFAAYLAPDWVPSDADLVKLETYQVRLHRQVGPGLPAKGRRLHRLRSRHVGTGCYVISRAAAARLLAATETVSDPIDEVMFNDASPLFAGLVTYQMVPSPVMQGKGAPKGEGQDGRGREAEQSQADWVESSIKDRSVLNGAQAEAALTRLWRWLRAEIWSLRAGTRYVVVPFG